MKEHRRNTEQQWLEALEKKSFPLSCKAQHLDPAAERVKCSSPGQCLLGKIPSWPEPGARLDIPPSALEGGNLKKR